MSDYNNHARKILLRRWEVHRSQLMESMNEKEYLVSYGALLAVSIILEECRHNGDGKDYIPSDQWVMECHRLGKNARASIFRIIAP